MQRGLFVGGAERRGAAGLLTHFRGTARTHALHACDALLLLVRVYLLFSLDRGLVLCVCSWFVSGAFGCGGCACARRATRACSRERDVFVCLEFAWDDEAKLSLSRIGPNDSFYTRSVGNRLARDDCRGCCDALTCSRLSALCLSLTPAIGGLLWRLIGNGPGNL